MKKIAGSGSICKRHGSADPDPDPYQKRHGSATLKKVYRVYIHLFSVSTTLRLYLQNAAVALLQRPKLFLTATSVVERHRQAVLQQDEGPDADDVVAARQLARSFAEYLRGRALYVQTDARLAPRVRTFDHLCV